MADIKVTRTTPEVEAIIADFIEHSDRNPECYQLEYDLFINYVVGWLSMHNREHWLAARSAGVIIAIRKGIRPAVMKPSPVALAEAVRGLSDEDKTVFFLVLMDN